MTKHSAGLNGDRPLELSNDAGRIASALVHGSTAPSPFIERGPQGPDAPGVSAKRVLAAIRARRLRAQYFAEELFADPAWDMMLHLFHAELLFRPVTVTRLSLASAVPNTTAIRWINTLVDKGLMIRRADPLDGRRVFVELTPGASNALRSYFAEEAHASHD
jgi:DNA-binding MarR family transcriptional regulator